METPRLLVAAMAAVVALGGCMDSPPEGKANAPRTHEFDLYVHPNASDTVPLYEKNDGNQSRAVAITFKAAPDDPQALPGPEIRVKEGDTVILRVHNLNGLMHTLHLHGGLIPWEEDGADWLTQKPIPQGETHTYTFRDLKAGTYWYHCHVDAQHHIDFGMYGALIVEERDPEVEYDRDYTVFLDEYDNCHVHGNTDPLTQQEMSPDVSTQSDCYYRFLLDNLAQNRLVTTTGQTTGGAVPPQAKEQVCPVLLQAPPSAAREQALVAAGCRQAHDHGTPPPQQQPRTWWPDTSPVYNPVYNTFLINGRAFPDTPVFPVREGETVKFRLINAGNLVHTWHPHGHTMLVTHKDGYPLPAPYQADTLAIAPGERYDFVMEMDNPGLWMVHDQMGQYTANDHQNPGGMTACIAYDGFRGVEAFMMKRSLDCNTEAMKILGDEHH
jgi:manganese oxidase